MMRASILLALTTLVLAGCNPAVPRDAEIVATLNSDRAGFARASVIACETPPLRRAQIEGGRLMIDGAVSVSGQREHQINAFMQTHQVLQVSCEESGVWFAMGLTGIIGSGQAKHLIFSPGGVRENHGRGLVQDTDRAVSADPRPTGLAYRDLGGGWYIRNSV